MSTDTSPVLVIRLSHLGDVALTIPALVAFGRQHPRRPLHVMTRAAYAPLVEAVPSVSRVWPVSDGARFPDAALGELRFHRIFDLQGGLKGLMARAGLTGPVTSMARGSITRRWAALIHDETGGAHAPRYKVVARTLGVSIDEVPEPLDLAAVVREQCDGDEPWPKTAGPHRVVLCPGSRWATKRWPPSSWMALAAGLSRDGVQVCILGSEVERTLLEACLPAEADAVWLATPGILGAARCLASAELAIACDSGLMHLSEVVGTPVLGLFGPTVPGFGFGPRLPLSQVNEVVLPCRPCSPHGGARCPRGHHRCMAELPTTAVLDRALDFLR